MKKHGCHKPVIFLAVSQIQNAELSFIIQPVTREFAYQKNNDIYSCKHCAAPWNILVFLMALVMIFSVNVKMALCMLIVLPFTLAVTLSQRRHIKPAFDRVRDCFSSLNAFAQETIAGNRVVKAFAKEDYELEKFDRENAPGRKRRWAGTAILSPAASPAFHRSDFAAQTGQTG